MKVAKSYAGYSFDETKAYEKNGKMYVKATRKCDRCTKGVYVCRVENGQPVPHPAFGGVCLQCGGSGIITKEVRLYTDKEFDVMEKSNEKLAEKKMAEREAKMKAEFDTKRAEWFDKVGFNENETTFIYAQANSYDIKNELKNAGFRFSKELLWHAPSIPAGYEEDCIEVSLSSVAQISAWGTGNFMPDAADTVKNLINEKFPQEEITSDWIFEEKEKFVEYPVTLVSIRPMETRYGYTQLVKFIDEFGNILQWWTTTEINTEAGDNVLLSGTVKKNDEYKGIKSTICTRCKIKVV